MSEQLHCGQPLDDLEALIRSAGDYVRASDDLRPRVLECARLERRERQMQRRLWALAICVCLFGAATVSVRQPLEVAQALQPEAALHAVKVLPDVDAISLSSDPSWEMVESFTQLRRRQAELLRL